MKAVLSLLLTALLLACVKPAEKTPSQNESSDAVPKEGAGEKADPDSGADEQVDIPANIAGSFLTCAIRKEATATDLETEVGCLLQDPVSRKKVHSDQISWTGNLSADELSVLPQEAPDLYNVLLRLKAKDLKALQEKAAALEAIATYRGQVLKKEKVYNVLKPAIELEDYEAPIVRDQSIDEDGDGSL